MDKQQAFINLVDQILAAKQQPPSSPFSKPKVGASKQGNYLTPTTLPSKNRSTKWSMPSTALPIGQAGSRRRRLRLWRGKLVYINNLTKFS